MAQLLRTILHFSRNMNADLARKCRLRNGLLTNVTASQAIVYPQPRHQMWTNILLQNNISKKQKKKGQGRGGVYICYFTRKIVLKTKTQKPQVSEAYFCWKKGGHLYHITLGDCKHRMWTGQFYTEIPQLLIFETSLFRAFLSLCASEATLETWDRNRDASPRGSSPITSFKPPACFSIL